MADDVVTDPGVLELYRERVARDLHPPQRQLDALVIFGSRALLDSATGWALSPETARLWLTELGERAAPLPDEGVPCG